MAEQPPGRRAPARVRGTTATTCSSAVEARTHCAPGLATTRRGGLFEGRDSVYRVRLLVEVDFARGACRVSGDFFRGEPTTQHVGWFLVPAPRIVTLADEIEIVGRGRFTFAAPAPLVAVHLPRRAQGGRPDEASLRFLSPDCGGGAEYRCTAYMADEVAPGRSAGGARKVVSLPARRPLARR